MREGRMEGSLLEQMLNDGDNGSQHGLPSAGDGSKGPEGRRTGGRGSADADGANLDGNHDQRPLTPEKHCLLSRKQTLLQTVVFTGCSAFCFSSQSGLGTQLKYRANIYVAAIMSGGLAIPGA